MDNKYFCEMSPDEYITPKKTTLFNTNYTEIEIVGIESAVVYLSEESAIKFANKILNLTPDTE